MKKLSRMIRRKLKLLLGREIDITPDVKCSTEFHGTEYGGWAVLSGSVNSSSRVMSVGIGEDASFDLSLIKSHGCQVYGFDPTPKSADWVRNNILDQGFHFNPVALAGYNGTIKLFLPRNTNHVSASCQQASHISGEAFEAPCFTLDTLLDQLGWDAADIVKMDIEGAEYAVIEESVRSGAIDKVNQLLIEFHHYFSGFSSSDTTHVIHLLRKHDFVIGWVSPSGHEVLFIRKHLV